MCKNVRPDKELEVDFLKMFQIMNCHHFSCAWSWIPSVTCLVLASFAHCTNVQLILQTAFIVNTVHTHVVV